LRSTRRRWGTAARVAVALLAVTAAGASCTSGSDVGARRTSSVLEGTPVPVPSGGTLVFGLEGEPGCLDWIGSCGVTSAGFWAANVTTIPRAFAVEHSGDGWTYQPTNLLLGEPSVVAGSRPVVTYTINPAAVWSDGVPITSADFSYTWRQVVSGPGVEDRAGYREIASIDDSDPSMVVVTFASPVADWKALFSGRVGVLPAHLLAGRDRAEQLANGYGWSGGPWKIASWKKGADLTLVPNDRYWGTKPKLDKVTFTFIEGGAEALKAFKAGEVLGIMPATDLDVIRDFAAGSEALRVNDTDETLETIGLAFNVTQAPFDDARVRQAIAFAVDRDAFHSKPPASFTPSLLSSFADSEAQNVYRHDLRRVESLMKAAGWRKNGDDAWTRRGVIASVAIMARAGDEDLARVGRILVMQLRAAGFEASFADRPAANLEKELASGEFGVVLQRFSLGSLYPNGCAVWCSKNIPAAGNGFTGGNIFRVRDDALDKALAVVESSLDAGVAKAANQQADRMLAEGAYALPIETRPAVLVTSAKVVGMVVDNPVMGPFWHLSTWGLQ
jgi:peptide/nickel transport system substrate-binding protein